MSNLLIFTGHKPQEKAFTPISYRTWTHFDIKTVGWWIFKREVIVENRRYVEVESAPKEIFKHKRWQEKMDTAIFVEPMFID